VAERRPGGAAGNAPHDLRVEHLTQPLGLGCRRPRLSWRLPPDTAAQRAYRIRLQTAAGPGWIGGRDSVLVSWPFAPLAGIHLPVISRSR
jgi:alpha-L-rhamnosidase